jgi:hypothetical protein
MLEPHCNVFFGCVFNRIFEVEFSHEASWILKTAIIDLHDKVLPRHLQLVLGRVEVQLKCVLLIMDIIRSSLDFRYFDLVID